jgi:hypothetical protein
MRRLFAVLVVLAVGVAALGFYRGWFDVGWQKSGDTGQLTGTVHQDKIEADRKQAVEKVQGLGGSKANADSK